MLEVANGGTMVRTHCIGLLTVEVAFIITREAAELTCRIACRLVGCERGIDVDGNTELSRLPD